MAEVLGRVLQPLVIRETPSCSSLVGPSPATIHGVVPQIALPLTESQHPIPRRICCAFSGIVPSAFGLTFRISTLFLDISVRQVATLSLFRIFDVATHHHIVPLVGGA